MAELAIHELPAALIRVMAFVFGALWGSFFNVAIHRWPRGMSVVRPPSHCPACKTPIPPFRNFPILGWLWLRGKAACCGVSIPFRYPLVEILGGVLCLAIAERWAVQAPPSTTMLDAAFVVLTYFVFAGGLLVATFVDLDWMQIPDEVTLPGTALALATATLRPDYDLESVVLGAGGGFLIIQLLFVWGYEALFGRRGMGEGDSKLLMMIGAFIGWKGAIFCLLAGSIQGIIAAVIAKLSGRSTIPNKVMEPITIDDPEELALDPGLAVLLDDDNTAVADASALDSNSQFRVRLAKGTVRAKITEIIPEKEEPETGRPKLPFGPFLSLAALEFLFFGERIIDWYLGFLQ